MIIAKTRFRMSFFGGGTDIGEAIPRRTWCSTKPEAQGKNAP